jgi:sRNA-binding protein
MTSAKPEPEKLTPYHQVRRHMEAAYPAVFTPRKTAPVPLAIGVGDRLFPELSALFGERSARTFLTAWTHRKEYRWAVLTGKNRHKLDGTVSGPITEGARAHARDWLVSRYAALYAKRKSRVDQVGDPAKRYRELADQEEVRRLVIEAARELVLAKETGVRKRRRKRFDHTEITTPSPS